jgi:pimeloyl-ACP methyl ester carboxylesterase
MQHLRVNNYDMSYIEVGGGATLVCVHGSLCDFRIWSPVLGPLSRRHRIIAVSMRYYFPEHWDGVGPGFTWHSTSPTQLRSSRRSMRVRCI